MTYTHVAANAKFACKITTRGSKPGCASAASSPVWRETNAQSTPTTSRMTLVGNQKVCRVKSFNRISSMTLKRQRNAMGKCTVRGCKSMRSRKDPARIEEGTASRKATCPSRRNMRTSCFGRSILPYYCHMQTVLLCLHGWGESPSVRSG